MGVLDRTSASNVSRHLDVIPLAEISPGGWTEQSSELTEQCRKVAYVGSSRSSVTVPFPLCTDWRICVTPGRVPELAVAAISVQTTSAIRIHCVAQRRRLHLY